LDKSERDLCIAKVTIGGAPIDDVHGCRDYHLALGTAKALGLDISPKLAELQAKLDAAKTRIIELESARKEPASATHAFDGDLVERLAEVCSTLPFTNSGFVWEDIARAILAELAKMPCELPTAKDLVQRVQCLTFEHHGEMVRAFFAAHIAPILAAKDARIADLKTAAKMQEAAIEKLNARIAELENQLAIKRNEVFSALGAAELLAREHSGETSLLKERIAELEKQLAPIDANGKTPGQIDHGARHDEWVRRGFASLRWDELTKDGQEVTDIGAQAVLAAFRPAIAAKALADLRETITHDDDPTGYFRAKINDAIEKLQVPKDATSDHAHEVGSCTYCDTKGITVPTKPTKPVTQ
jgi:uncharacterized coiled-coil protein SlyX